MGSLRRPERLSGCRFRVVLYCRHAPAPKGFDPNSMQQWRSRLITPGEKEPENIFGAVGRNGSPELGLPVVEPGKVDAMTVIEDRVLVIRRITLPPEDKDRFYGLILDDIMPRMFDLPGMLRAEVFGSETEVLIMVLWKARITAAPRSTLVISIFRNSVGLPTCRNRLTFCNTVTMLPGT